MRKTKIEQEILQLETKIKEESKKIMEVEYE